VHNVIFVNEIHCHANHCENSKDVVFWKKLLWIFFDDFFETLIALFHDDARKVRFVFDNINNLTNQWVILELEHSNFSLGLRL